MTLAPNNTPSLIAPSELPFNPDATPLKLGVMASGSGSNFEAIAQAIADRQLNAKIHVLIYNNPDAKAAIRAAQWTIPAVLLNHRDFASREALDGAIVQTLREHDVEWVIMAGWMRIVTSRLIDAFPDRVINIHPSLLPSFKGAHAIQQAFTAGVKITGCTVHLVQLEVDSGTILMQAAVPILPDDTVETLQARIQVQEHRIFPPAIAIAAQL
ncbi:MAG: phosphoribosylglycinamide formyltransferase [Leptolyngbya sp.]|nr:MAG: phosphoribosylglycinamide formyltransferase [Leptolyngbya sp.]